MEEPNTTSDTSGEGRAVLNKQTNWQRLYYYQKSDVLYRLTFLFCARYFPKYGDRTVDQMVQAARSGKQNIVEGFADGVTSIEMELKLLNVARASFKELREDYVDYIHTRGLELWSPSHSRYDAMLKFCREHNKVSEYEPIISKCSDEELANIAITLCHMVDKMISSHLQREQKDFVENGGIRERMTAARLGRRKKQNEEIAELRKEIARLSSENYNLRRRLAAATPQATPPPRVACTAPPATPRVACNGSQVLPPAIASPSSASSPSSPSRV